MNAWGKPKNRNVREKKPKWISSSLSREESDFLVNPGGTIRIGEKKKETLQSGGILKKRADWSGNLMSRGTGRGSHDCLVGKKPTTYWAKGDLGRGERMEKGREKRPSTQVAREKPYNSASWSY